jgi:flagellar motor protein MotB
VARVLAGACLLCACATAPRAHGSTLDPLFASARLGRVRELAPDLLARAQRARQDALDARTTDARSDHELRARLLLQAAEVEADRIEIERKTAALQQRSDAAEAARAADERARLLAEAQAKQAEAARLAQAEAAAAFAPLELTAAATPGRVPSAQAREQAASFFVKRARLTLTAAVALGADAAMVGDAQAKLQAAQATQTGPSAPLTAAQNALLAAERALGSARARRPDASPEQAQDLVQRLAELGVQAEQRPAGVVVTLPGLFAPGGATARSLARPRWTLLRGLLAAFPAGPIRIEAHAPAGATKPRQKLARARALAVQAWLAQTLPLNRLLVDAAAFDLESDDNVALLLGAYGRERFP